MFFVVVVVIDSVECSLNLDWCCAFVVAVMVYVNVGNVVVAVVDRWTKSRWRNGRVAADWR